MAKKPIKLTKKDLEDDEILDLADQAYIFLKLHINKILGVIILVFAVYGVVVVLHQRKEANLRAASDEYFVASQTFDDTLSSAPWATTERTDGMARVVQQANAIIEKHGNTEVARNALFLKGNAYYFAGDRLGTTDNTMEAIRVFQEYEEMAANRGDDFERAAALLALGYAHENMHLLLLPVNAGEAASALNAAVEYYDRAIALSGAGFLRYEALNAKGRLAEYLGRIDDARGYYEQVVRERYREPKEPPPDSSERQQFMYQLRLLANQFTTGNSAVIALRQMGVDVDALIAELESEQRG